MPIKQTKLPCNSANRLLTILHKAHSIGQEHPELPIRDVFASAMQIKRTSTAFYAAWAKLFYLIEQLKKEILQIPEPKSGIYTKAIQEVVKNISLSDLSQSWEEVMEFKFTLNNPTWHGFQILELCALDLGNREIEITPDKLNKFQFDIEKLLQEIKTLNLNLTIKFFLEEHLNDLKEKIDYYQFYGSEGLKKSVENSLGALFLKNPEFEPTSESEQKILQQFLKLLKYILDILIPVNLQLPETVLNSLDLRILQHSESSI
ncbi:hypothetical protein PCC7424_3503 [Gloeothece citriformis PCC 7424]|uniref:Uncharacterized protein n=1 Tax=Gloeothece citriformis (strain PCC 7424) TaxID=65393 RepID=B7KFH9_GLOC7|nr:hypothetical protein [Gloeothece citriformis]ACK71895.1 hypothetical protein PCC7424_3503 [Gloeothece citriformis PCC 7424]